jgi:RNA polymerase sigma-70 factor (ECF subfamily)
MPSYDADPMLHIGPLAGRLRRYAMFLTRSRADADDLIQETMLRVLTKLHLWQPGTDFRAWSFTIMRNQNINNIRRRARMNRLLAEAAPDPAVSGNQLASVELRDVAAALGELPAAQRSIIVLVGRDGAAYTGVARSLGIPIGTVRSRLSRARTALRERLEPPDREPGRYRDRGNRVAADDGTRRPDGRGRAA